MRAILLILIIAVLAIIVAIATGFLNINQIRGARTPEISTTSNGVVAKGGQAPAFDVETGSVKVGSKEATSGKGYFMGDFRGLEASIKDSKRFKDEPGSWAYFSFGHKYPLKAEVSKNAAAACNQCHQGNAKTDWVFSQYYPVLRAAAPHSK